MKLKVRPLTPDTDTVNVNVLNQSLNANVLDKVATTVKYLAPTSLSAGGTATVWTPANGKAIRLKFVSITTNSSTLITLRQGTTDWIAFYCPANSVIQFNLFGANVQFPTNTNLVVFTSNATTLSVTALGDEV